MLHVQCLHFAHILLDDPLMSSVLCLHFSGPAIEISQPLNESHMIKEQSQQFYGVHLSDKCVLEAIAAAHARCFEASTNLSKSCRSVHNIP